MQIKRVLSMTTDTRPFPAPQPFVIIDSGPFHFPFGRLSPFVVSLSNHERAVLRQLRTNGNIENEKALIIDMQDITLPGPGPNSTPLQEGQNGRKREEMGVLSKYQASPLKANVRKCPEMSGEVKIHCAPPR